MAKTRELVVRRKAIRNIRKITRTMELIATARFKKAMDRTVEAAAYTKRLLRLLLNFRPLLRMSPILFWLNGRKSPREFCSLFVRIEAFAAVTMQAS